jgi:hypothetical protein
VTSGGRRRRLSCSGHTVKDQSEPRIDGKAEEGKQEKRHAECDARRPACCPTCKAPSRPLGGGVQLHGHGRRSRMQRGPEAAGEPPVERDVGARRYRCKKCGTTTTVSARGVLRRRLYSAGAIALALALFGLEGQPACAVREAIAPTASPRGAAEGAGWNTLRRWAGEAKAGTLVDGSSACPGTFTLRQAAERAAMMFQALGSRGADKCERVFQGALETRWRGAS